MKELSRVAGTLLLLLIAATSTFAQKVEFSADMQVSNGAGQTHVLKLFVGNKRARFDRPKQGDDANGLDSLVIDFQNQFIFLVIPQSKMYLQIGGSSGTPFYRGAWMFRPDTPKYPCNGWVSEADKRGITLRCTAGGSDTVSGRTVQRWDAVTTDAGRGSLWYDPNLNFITKVQRTSKAGVQSGFELTNVVVGTQPTSLFEIPSDYRKFTLTMLADVLLGLGQW